MIYKLGNQNGDCPSVICCSNQLYAKPLQKAFVLSLSNFSSSVGFRISAYPFRLALAVMLNAFSFFIRVLYLGIHMLFLKDSLSVEQIYFITVPTFSLETNVTFNFSLNLLVTNPFARFGRK